MGRSLWFLLRVATGAYHREPRQQNQDTKVEGTATTSAERFTCARRRRRRVGDHRRGRWQGLVLLQQEHAVFDVADEQRAGRQEWIDTPGAVGAGGIG